MSGFAKKVNLNANVNTKNARLAGVLDDIGVNRNSLGGVDIDEGLKNLTKEAGKLRKAGKDIEADIKDLEINKRKAELEGNTDNVKKLDKEIELKKKDLVNGKDIKAGTKQTWKKYGGYALLVASLIGSTWFGVGKALDAAEKQCILDEMKKKGILKSYFEVDEDENIVITEKGQAELTKEQIDSIPGIQKKCADLTDSVGSYIIGNLWESVKGMGEVFLYIVIGIVALFLIYYAGKTIINNL